jgi:hypothetical protein
MKLACTCSRGIPVITTVHPLDLNAFLASHCCSQCGAYLFDEELKAGEQIIATNNIVSSDGKYTIPKGRLLRITAFIDMPPCTGFLFAGLLAAGGFRPEGFAAKWDIEKILGLWG